MSNTNLFTPTVAVLMATYNGEKYIEEQIASIMGQESVNVYLFIRDDHSSDGTVALVGELQKKHHQIFLLNPMPEQLKVTKNFYSILRDIDLTTMDYMAWADQDDIWMKNKLSEALRMMNDKDSDCYASNLILGDENGKIITGRSIYSKLISYLLNNKTNRQTQFDHYLEAASAGCTLVLGKQAALYFQERVRQIYHEIPVDASHDWSTYAITRLGRFKWFIDARSFIIYRQHGQNAYGTNSGMKGASKLLDLFRTGWYRKHILMIDTLYNEGTVHPPFMDAVRSYQHASLLSRWKLGFAIAGYRRKIFHKVLLFGLIIFGQFK